MSRKATPAWSGPGIPDTVCEEKPPFIPESTVMLVIGGGDLGTGVAHRLHRAGFKVVVAELAEPTVIRRAVAFASAVYEGKAEVEGVEARLVSDIESVWPLLGQHIVPVLVDAEGTARTSLKPHVIVDARMAKRNLGVTLNDARIVIGLGPGFSAGDDVHAVVETNRGHNLGRVILKGTAEPDTPVPGRVRGHGRERVLWAPRAGRFRSEARIGQQIEATQVVAWVEEQAVRASISGVLRGLAHGGLFVRKGQKVGDIDPRGIAEYCFTISDKARAIGGSVLEAVLHLRQHLTTQASSVKVSAERSGEDGL
jgi:xanthine dehydrogenase accessory factor